MTWQEIQITVNGMQHRLSVAPNRRLIDLLREDLALTGTKEGCGVGICGACTVLLDGRVASGCLTLAVMADGCEITTIEGLQSEGVLHLLQKTFLDKSAVQCGFCTPGFIMAAKALLDASPDPSDSEIEEMFLGNLCRCTGYYKIVTAVKAAAAEMRGA